MSINGIQPTGGTGDFLRGLDRREHVRTPDAAPERVNTPAQPAALPTATAARDAVPAEAPPGTDQALWAVLTAEERSFFAHARSMGPLTYGPGRSDTDQAPGIRQGGRIDVRV